MTAIVEPGTPIAVIAPAGIFQRPLFETGLAIARRHGHDLRPLPDLLQPHRYLAGTDAHRLAQLVEAMTSPEYGAVWLARGGYGITRLIDHLPEKLPRRPLIGFSDATALFCALPDHPHVHGPVIHSLEMTDAASRRHLFALLAGEPVPPMRGNEIVAGRARGRLLGGNLCLLAATCGTRHQLDATGAILVIEEVGEPAYRVAGVAVGELVRCGPPDGPMLAREVLLEDLARLGVPMVADLPIGHGPANRAWRWGGRAVLDHGTLTLE
jgi:muramoyltetrapeptide carboxypeptidase